MIVAGGAALLGAGCSAPGEFVEPPLPGLSFDVVAVSAGGEDWGAPFIPDRDPQVELG